MLVHSKKAFFLPSVWPGIEYTWALISKKSLLICFESYQGIPYSHTDRVIPYSHTDRVNRGM